MRGLWWLAAILTLVGAAPILGLLMSLAVSSLADCAINEGGVTPCIVWGVDLGPVLTYATVMGWLAILSWPLAMVGLGMLAILAVIGLRRAWRDRR